MVTPPNTLQGGLTKFHNEIKFRLSDFMAKILYDMSFTHRQHKCQMTHTLKHFTHHNDMSLIAHEFKSITHMQAHIYEINT